MTIMNFIGKKHLKKLLLYFLILFCIFMVYSRVYSETSAQTNPNTNSNTETNTQADTQIPEAQTQQAQNTTTLELEKDSLWSIIDKGGPVMYPLILLALLCLTLILERSIFLTVSKLASRKRFSQFMQDKDRELRESGQARFREDHEDALRQELLLYKNRMEKGLVLLNGGGNLAPLVGFLGTVTGMISAFAAIASAETVNAKIVASGIQEALITTAAGLTIAVPAIAAFHFFSHLVQNILNHAEGEIGKLSANLPRLSDEL